MHRTYHALSGIRESDNRHHSRPRPRRAVWYRLLKTFFLSLSYFFFQKFPVLSKDFLMESLSSLSKHVLAHLVEVSPLSVPLQEYTTPDLGSVCPVLFAAPCERKCRTICIARCCRPHLPLSSKGPDVIQTTLIATLSSFPCARCHVKHFT